MTTQETIKKIQETEFDILQKIEHICKEHDITYFAVGGSVLGAVRHQGFIPWDDDIDIAMPRKDYEKFLRYAAEELSEGYFLQTFFTEKNSPFYFTKVRKDNTKFVECYLRDLDIHHGIFVDIFPFDNVPDNDVIKKLHYKLCRLASHLFLSKSLITVRSSETENNAGYKTFIRKLLHILLLPVPKALLFRFLDRSVQMFNNRECKEISHIVRKRLRIKLEDLYPLTELPFGEMIIPVPKNYDAYLTSQYGDYKNPPEKDNQYGHLPYLIEFQHQEDEK